MKVGGSAFACAPTSHVGHEPTWLTTCPRGGLVPVTCARAVGRTSGCMTAAGVSGWDCMVSFWVLSSDVVVSFPLNDIPLRGIPRNSRAAYTLKSGGTIE